MSTLTPNIGLEKVTSSQTIGELQESMNGSGGNMDILDTKIGPVGNTSLQAQVDSLNSKLQGTRIFSNPSRTMSGTIQTTESITNYRWLLFIWKTNAEYVSELLPAFSSMKAFKSISAGAWDSTNNRFAYNAWCGVAFSGNTNATVDSGYNNGNFQMGIYEIWGIG